MIPETSIYSVSKHLAQLLTQQSFVEFEKADRYTETDKYATVSGLNWPFKYEAQAALFKDPVRTAQ